MHIYDCFPPGWHQNLQDNINFLRIAKQSSGRSHDKTKEACVFMYESSFCLHPPRLDEICVYLEVTWSQRFAKTEESKRSLKRRKTWESQVPFQIFFSEQSLFYQKHVENTLVYKMIEKIWKERSYLSYSPTGLILIRGAPFYERGPCLHIETLEVQQKKQRHDNYLPSHNHFVVVLVIQI